MFLKVKSRWFTAVTIALMALSLNARAAVFAIAPPAWGGVLAGAGIMAGGGGVFMAGEKVENKAGRGALQFLGGLLLVVGFLVLDDDKVIPELKEIDLSDAKLMKTLASQNLSEEDVEAYNEYRTRITALANTVVYDADYSKLSDAEKSSLLFKKARANGVPESALKVAGLLGEAVKHAYAR